MNEVYVGDVGTLIVLDTGIVLTGATVTQIRYRKPSGAVGTWTATIVAATSGANNGVGFATLAGSLDEAGMWQLNAKVSLGGWSGLGSTASMVVHNEFG